MISHSDLMDVSKNFEKKFKACFQKPRYTANTEENVGREPLQTQTDHESNIDECLNVANR